MMKVVINTCYGGFFLSEEAYKFLGLKWDDYGYVDNEDFGIEDDNYKAFRTHSKLIECVEKLGDKANGEHAKLKVIEIPNGIDWRIDEYDGIEWISEGRTWG